MNENLRLNVKCPSCRKPFHLAPEELVPERRAYLCPRCGTGVDLTSDQEKIASDLLKNRMAEKRES